MKFRAVVWFALLLLPLLISAQTDKPATASITGRITYKNQPLADLTVTLESSNSGSRLSRPIVAQTDADGRYRLTGIAAGRYVVSPRALAYAVPRDGESWYAGKSVTISEGEAIEGLDFAMVKGGVITGTITDHNGRAVIGQRVHLNRLDEKAKATDFQNGNMWMYSTDDRGVYRLYGLPAGRYKVSVGEGQDSRIVSIGRAGGLYRMTYYPGVSTEADAKVIELSESGEVTDIDIKLDKPMRMYEARGRVVDGTTGAPLVGLRCGYGQLLQGEMRVSQTSEETNANGEFVLRSLQPGQYRASVTSEVTPEYYSDQLTFEVTNQNAEGLEIKAYRGATINGQLVIEGTSDPAHRQFLQRVGITARPEAESSFVALRSARINADGTFRITGLRPGKTRLNTYVPEAVPLVLVRAERDGVLLREDLNLTAAEQVSGIKFVFAHGTGVLRGQVNIA
ncbi:MAG TPA: carboxypeptidase-like regulatory domain-containing protein, partial [Blastocatellia bacterium]|nr:carboxypeptidase-like regulatory domain-containing protein [Blastocatellia bacterium]